MTDPTLPPASYVDTYNPPGGSSPAAASVQSQPQRPPESPVPSSPPPFQPPSQQSQSPQPTPPAPAPSTSETLEDQNIFTMLGVDNATDEEKEAFLDELQQVIWEDFLENDVSLLLTQEEMTGLKQIMGDKPNSDLDQQEAIVVYLEKYVPDLEQIMLEKALELKEDMVRERLAGLREFYAGQSDKTPDLDRAEQQMAQGQWRTAAQTLNQLTR